MSSFFSLRQRFNLDPALPEEVGTVGYGVGTKGSISLELVTPIAGRREEDREDGIRGRRETWAQLEMI